MILQERLMYLSVGHRLGAPAILQEVSGRCFSEVVYSRQAFVRRMYSTFDRVRTRPSQYRPRCLLSRFVCHLCPKGRECGCSCRMLVHAVWRALVELSRAALSIFSAFFVPCLYKYS